MLADRPTVQDHATVLGRLMRGLPERVRPVQRTQRHRPTHPDGDEVRPLGTSLTATREVAA